MFLLMEIFSNNVAMAQILELKFTTDQARIFSINFERRVLAESDYSRCIKINVSYRKMHASATDSNLA